MIEKMANLDLKEPFLRGVEEPPSVQTGRGLPYNHLRLLQPSKLPRTSNLITETPDFQICTSMLQEGK